MCHGNKVKDSAEEFIDKLMSTLGVANVKCHWIDFDYRMMWDLISIAQCTARRLGDKDRLKKLKKVEKKFSKNIEKGYKNDNRK